MTCTSCGDKPKGSSKGFPKAVVEINNPESLVLLRKVVIPVSMGTEEDVPPAIGKYFNVLLQYESNGHIYLYSSDGIPTAIEANIPQEVLDRIDQLEIDVDLLETGLANETEAREAADSALSSSINSLSSSLSAETAAREQADTTLQNNITAEATARANADTNLQNQIAQEAQARAAADTAINGAITAEASTRQTADAGLQSQIDAITASSDVKDIVGTKAELNNYDTSTLGNNDIIKVLQDESENNATTYYRWNATTQQFTLIGEEGPYYTKSQADTLLNAKQNTLTAGSNVQIVNDTISATDTTYTAGTGLALNGTQFSVDTTAIATQSDLTAGLANKQDTLTAGANIQINNNTISATDTTYSDFTGTDGTTAGAAGLVPAPATTDAGKFLKADGTWDTSSATFYTGENVSDLKVYKASRADEIYGDAFYNDGLVTQYGATHSLRGDINIPLDVNRGAPHGIFLGTGAYPKYADGVSNSMVEGVISIGYDSDARSRYPQGSSITRTWSPYHISIGHSAGKGFSGTVSSLATTFIGAGTYSTVSGSDMLRDVSVAVGFGSTTSRIDEFSIGAGSADPRTIYTTRYLANVKAGSLDTDAVNVEQLNGRVKTNAGAPTTSTVGTVGQILEDTTNGKLYICTDATNPYVWEEVGGGGSVATINSTDWSALWQ